MLLSEGQMSDYKGAALMLGVLPPAKAILGDRGYPNRPDRTRHHPLYSVKGKPEATYPS